MLELIKNWTNKDEDGASAVEYGLLVAGIAALIVLIVFAFGGVIKDVFNDTCDTIQTAGGADGDAPAPLTFGHQGTAVGVDRSLVHAHWCSTVSSIHRARSHHGTSTRRRQARLPSSTDFWSPASPR